MLKFASRALLTPVVRVLFRAKVVGKKNVPLQGPVILASNHLSFIDSVVITLLAPRTVSFLAKDSYFNGSGLKGFVSRAFFRSIGAIPVTRGVGQAAQDALDAGLELLEEDSAFAIYPEGTRSLDGRLYRGRTGVAWLALKSGAPVVPVGIGGTDKVQPPGSKGISLARIQIRFGQPLDLTAYGKADSGKARRHGTDAVMAAIAELTGQEVVPHYNEPPPKGLVETVRRRFFERFKL